MAPVDVRHAVQPLQCSAGLRCKQGVTDVWVCIALSNAVDNTKTRSLTGSFSASRQKCLCLKGLFLSAGVIDDKLQIPRYCFTLLRGVDHSGLMQRCTSGQPAAVTAAVWCMIENS